MEDYKISIKDKATKSIEKLVEVLNGNVSEIPNDNDPIVFKDRTYSSAATRLSKMLNQIKDDKLKQNCALNSNSLDNTTDQKVQKILTETNLAKIESNLNILNIVSEPKLKLDKCFDFIKNESDDYTLKGSKIGELLNKNSDIECESFPEIQELVKLIQLDQQRIEQLVSQNEFLMSILKNTKLEMDGILKENNLLHEELRKNVLEDIARAHYDINIKDNNIFLVEKSEHISPLENISNDVFIKNKNGTNIHDMDFKFINEQLEHVNKLNVSKVNTLQSQLSYFRNEKMRLEEELAELQLKVSLLEEINQSSDLNKRSYWTALCSNCFENKTIHHPNKEYNYSEELSKLKKENATINSELTNLRLQIVRAESREDELKKCLNDNQQNTNKTSLEMTQAFIERAQLKEELSDYKERLQVNLNEMNQHVEKECQLLKQTFSYQFNDLKNKNIDLLTKLSSLELSLEKERLDKLVAIKQLEQLKKQLGANQSEFDKLTDSMKTRIITSRLSLNQDHAEVDRLKNELDNFHSKKNAEFSKTKEELDLLTLRLMETERELLQSKEEALNLINDNQMLRKQKHELELINKSLRGQTIDHISKTDESLKNRQIQMDKQVVLIQNKYERTIMELEENIKSYENILVGLKQECKQLMHYIENMQILYSLESSKLIEQNGELVKERNSLSKQLKDRYEEQVILKSINYKIRNRLFDLDSKYLASSERINDLLSRVCTDW